MFLCKVVLNENATLSNLSYIRAVKEIYDAVVYGNLLEAEEELNEEVEIVLAGGFRIRPSTVFELALNHGKVAVAIRGIYGIHP